ncbi:hypothetical protein C2R22_21930 (plasmid) [Salinigranum rubrum]|uniref:DUF8025 domain-containing protein n=1 Tax=Salinigranum rubrum TaxID=755307 RepID=A0A2I8VQM0_9EURY|nr:hypothetical protein [Salinigranum rubrum]AUV84223.1 hypothetical protein C2R22_21930 [Salinigranum rubrum]
MTHEAANNPFDECELGPDAVLGTCTFQDVLFTNDTETLVNVLTSETPAHSQTPIEEATEFAASIDTDTLQIALPASVKTQIETQSKPSTSAAFIYSKQPARPSRADYVVFVTDTEAGQQLLIRIQTV